MSMAGVGRGGGGKACEDWWFREGMKKEHVPRKSPGRGTTLSPEHINAVGCGYIS